MPTSSSGTADVRRVPLWGRVTAAALARHQTLALETRRVPRQHAGQSSLVTRYRYPETPSGIGVTTVLRGPERVFLTPPHEARREPRRRGRPPRARKPGRAEDRCRHGREPADRIRGAADQPQPLHGVVPRHAAQRRRSRRSRATTRSSSTARCEPGGQIPFPLLGERRHSADATTPNSLGRPQAADSYRGKRRRRRGVSAVHRRPC